MSDALTLKEAAEIAGESVRTLRRRIDAGRLDAFQRGGATSPILVTREALSRYLGPRALVGPLSSDVEERIREIVREEIAKARGG